MNDRWSCDDGRIDLARERFKVGDAWNLKFRRDGFASFGVRVGNGNELGGGSVRLHRREKQEQVFGMMGYAADDLQERFGALLDGLEHGAPPHGGIAMGVDRFAMILADEDNIREVIAFPKNQRGVDVMFSAPSVVDTQQLDDLGQQLKPAEPTPALTD